MSEPWMEAERREARWDRWLGMRPVCADCGQPIVEERYFPADDGPLCPRCTRGRMVEIDE